MIKLVTQQAAASPADMWQLPPDSWDTHVHVFSPSTHPYASSRSYSPASASWSQLLEFNDSLGENPTNLVLVQPSPYGTDNTLILGLLRLHKEKHGQKSKTRAILVLDLDQTTKDDLFEMDNLGVRGIRINMEASGLGANLNELKKFIVRTAEAIKGASLADKWFIQLYIAGELWDGK
jgi:predicted TIM-barrel fold metal-dependent hydrolase